MPENRNPNFECTECYCNECEPCTPDGDRVRCQGCGAVYNVVFKPSFNLRKHGRFWEDEQAEQEVVA